MIISGEAGHDRGFVVYQQYINWIWKTVLESRNAYEQHSKGLEDQLQVSFCFGVKYGYPDEFLVKRPNLEPSLIMGFPCLGTFATAAG